mgnify:CR=1 FL=1
MTTTETTRILEDGAVVLFERYGETVPDQPLGGMSRIPAVKLTVTVQGAAIFYCGCYSSQEGLVQFLKDLRELVPVLHKARCTGRITREQYTEMRSRVRYWFNHARFNGTPGRRVWSKLLA